MDRIEGIVRLGRSTYRRAVRMRCVVRPVASIVALALASTLLGGCAVVMLAGTAAAVTASVFTTTMPRLEVTRA